MATNTSINTGLYTLNEQTSRVVTKLAPDMFVTFMGSTDVRIAMSGSSSVSMDMGAGLSSISAVTDNTPGGGRCTITMVCPQYDSLNQTYYLTQPDGTKTPFFTAMMDVRVFAKGRFLDKEGNPSYYPIFWGYIRSVNETYSGSETSFSLNCVNMLAWWERQIVNLNLVAGQATYQGEYLQPACNAYRKMNPWEIILNLFYDTSFNNFIWPSAIGENNATIPSMLDNFFKDVNMGGVGGYKEIAKNVTESWRSRYGFGEVLSANAAKTSGVSNLEMFGMSKIIKVMGDNSPFTEVARKNAADDFVTGGRFGTPAQKAKTNTPAQSSSKDNNKPKPVIKYAVGDSMLRALNNHVGDDTKADLDFGVLGKVMPYGELSLRIQ